jgi:LysR family glycine cleavage system transcriptional activator
MPRDLPPTESLRAFACVARTLSMKDAAAELHLSPSALSRRIQALEEHLGTPLFTRLNPGLELTPAGVRYRERVDAALAQLAGAQDELAARRGPLRISALASFSESWLIPHLPEFEQAHGIAVEVEATLRYADFARDPVDVAIRFGTGPWEELHAEPILDLDFAPVCAPGLPDGDPPLRRPEDLAQHTLIHSTQTPDAWPSWLRRAGVGQLVPRREVRYDHAAIALSAAEAGQGVALSFPLLCETRVREGRLVRPFQLSVRSEQTYHFVCRPADLANDPRIRALRDWLVDRLA